MRDPLRTGATGAGPEPTARPALGSQSLLEDPTTAPLHGIHPPMSPQQDSCPPLPAESQTFGKCLKSSSQNASLVRLGCGRGPSSFKDCVI